MVARTRFNVAIYVHCLPCAKLRSQIIYVLRCCARAANSSVLPALVRN